METDDFIFAVADQLLQIRNYKLIRRYRRSSGSRPNVANPRTYAERMLWRKTVDHNPQFILFSDKLATKGYVRQRCPDLPLPRTLWVGMDTDAIPDELLRGDVFVKANHGSSFNYCIHDGRYDRKELGRISRYWLASRYGQKNGEWGYHQVERKLFVEEAIGDIHTGLIEFNIYASNGRPIMGSVMGKVKTPEEWMYYLDPAGNAVLGMYDPEGSPVRSLPARLNALPAYHRAIQFTKELSRDVDFARFDFLWNGVELYGGEITLYPDAATSDPDNATAHAAVLEGWDLSQSHFLKTERSGWQRWYAEALRRRLEKEKCSIKEKTESTRTYSSANGAP